ncbi:hypothetical protein A3842_11080 [Paenibacillus sp. P3E]|nr:hypothetical protein A3842_11080 [Paenibacillus sp. P3E]
MTQVKEMTNPELNLALALLCGHREISEREDVEQQRQRNDYVGSGVVVLYGNHYIVRANGKYGTWDPCSDPAASLEVQTAACAMDKEEYIWNIVLIKWGQSPILFSAVSNSRAADIACATPRERSEAAYMVLSQHKPDTAPGYA